MQYFLFNYFTIWKKSLLVTGLQFLNNEGSGLYLTQSKLNHSCVPNAQPSFPYSDHTLAIKALTAIRAGEEICISYLDECSLERSRHSRQKVLWLILFEFCVNLNRLFFDRNWRKIICLCAVVPNVNRNRLMRMLQVTRRRMKKKMEMKIATWKINLFVLYVS